jgi:hypothetical protein
MVISVKRRSMRPLVLAVLALLLAGGAVWWLWRETQVGRAEFDKVQIGWSLAQVENLLGPGRQTADAYYWGEPEQDLIMIVVGPDKRVLEKRYLPSNLSDQERFYRITRRKLRETLRLSPEP